ncbi:MAG TPA: DUF2784 domain-containing protein [Methylibium sp.]|nr:DUF2784 domain-containing protein [Methylibium sp.]
MLWSRLADALLLLHGLFVLWVVLGGLAVLARPRLAWAHLPCAAWGVWVELAGWVCPLTPFEQQMRLAAGEAGYAGGFVEHYLTAAIYPEGLTRELQIVLGLAVLGLNGALYLAVWWRGRRAAGARRPG